MNHDITFCSNAEDCPQHQTCRRAYLLNGDGWVAFSDFYNPDDEKCNMYWPTSEEKDRPILIFDTLSDLLPIV